MMSELLNLAVRAAKAAGKEILKNYNDYKLYIKPDKSPLTTADLAANDVIFKILEKSKIPICSEEKILPFDERKNCENFWLIDPLDGTQEFIAKNGEFCVCIALIGKDGCPKLSVIMIPFTDEVFCAERGGKIYKNGKILKSLEYTSPLFLLGRHGNSKKRIKFAKNFGYEYKRIGSAIKFCRLAENAAASYLRLGPSSLWDIAAGDLLVEASGGITIDLKTKKPPVYNGENLLNNPFLVLDRNSVDFLDEYINFIMTNSYLK